MSRVGRKPINLPGSVEVSVGDGEVIVKGKNGSLKHNLPEGITTLVENGTLKVERFSDERGHRALHGLTRTLLANMVTGVSEGFVKSLELVGVGYRVQQNGSGLTLSVMLSHTVEVQPREGVALDIEGNNRINVRGIDKQIVGQVAAEIRSVRPPNSYTGKGIRYLGEEIKVKPGKSARRTI